MCDTCGCSSSEAEQRTRIIDVNQSLVKSNEEAASKLREYFDQRCILAVNLISSPGSGKTTLLEKTSESIGNDIKMAVLEGDIETELDAERIRAKGVPAIQLTTGGACHLDSSLVHKGIHALEDQMNGNVPDILFIENVGNLVCPAFFDLGEHLRVILISVPEGHDKPVKYPKAMRTGDVLLITKADLLSYFNFDIDKIRKDALSLNPSLTIFVLSAETGEGLDSWYEFIKKQLKIKDKN